MFFFFFFLKICQHKKVVTLWPLSLAFLLLVLVFLASFSENQKVLMSMSKKKNPHHSYPDVKESYVPLPFLGKHKTKTSGYQKSVERTDKLRYVFIHKADFSDFEKCQTSCFPLFLVFILSYTNHHLPAHLYNAQTRQWKFFSPNSQPRKWKANYTKTVPSVINRLKSCDKTKYILNLIAMYVKVGLNHPGGMMAGENWNHFFVLPKIFINSYCCGDVMKPRTHFPVWWLLNTTFHRNSLPVG